MVVDKRGLQVGGPGAAVLVAAVLLLVCCAIVEVQAQQQAPPVLQVVATSHYDAGLQVGTKFADRINAYLSHSQTLREDLIPMLSKPADKAWFDRYVATSKAHYPQYYEEIQGIAAGAKVEFTYLLLLALEDELLHHDVSTHIPADELSCSDIHIHKLQTTMFGHNEDASALVKEYGYILSVNITPSNGPAQQYTAFTYPGMLSGNAFGWNKHIAFSCNALFPLAINMGGIGRSFINRDILASSSIADAVVRATPDGRAIGFAFNMASLVAPYPIVSVEVAPNSYSYYSVQGNYSHFNMYKQLEAPQGTDESTVHRQSRVYALPAPARADDIRNILGDTHDKDYPIYRDGAAPDTGVVTVATALFNLNEARVTIWHTNPKLSTTNGTLSFKL
eukprot:TRINITY_DN1810_c0_g1_i2.p1 TRINITY_DN1810_c0_g1~~TRINITY_DN1810_c0_g1_i2.p1  ORF type:complete len:392 (+),score=56.25 TRINITY_DN1810_c0_g1_i2:46-1221(+)